ATYQRLVNKMFAQQIGKTMEMYVDDMLVKSHKPRRTLGAFEDNFCDHERTWDETHPNKCTFGVAGGNF
ncbi:UNVERIFIED_CONTAM: hypothetical protein Sindi_1441600, partial [Sesamum indicum]